MHYWNSEEFQHLVTAVSTDRSRLPIRNAVACTLALSVFTILCTRTAVNLRCAWQTLFPKCSPKLPAH